MSELDAALTEYRTIEKETCMAGFGVGIGFGVGVMRRQSGRPYHRPAKITDLIATPGDG